MLKHYYILDGKMAIQCDSLMEWAEWFETADRRVAVDNIGDIRISTVFLGIDHNWSPKGDPLLFETLVFFPDHEYGEMRRYFTWAEAEVGHKEVCEIIKEQTMDADYLTADVIRALTQTIKQDNS